MRSLIRGFVRSYEESAEPNATITGILKCRRRSALEVERCDVVALVTVPTIRDPNVNASDEPILLRNRLFQHRWTTVRIWTQ
jgi:hypothetical protein